MNCSYAAKQTLSWPILSHCTINQRQAENLDLMKSRGYYETATAAEGEHRLKFTGSMLLGQSFSRDMPMGYMIEQSPSGTRFSMVKLPVEFRSTFNLRSQRYHVYNTGWIICLSSLQQFMI